MDQRNREVAAEAPPEAGLPASRGVKAGLIGGALAALASVVCWVVPLILVSIGVTGAWMSTITALAPYKGWLILFAFGCMAYAGYKIFLVRPAEAACAAGSACGTSQSSRFLRIMFWVVSALLLAAIASPYLAPYFFEE